MASPRLLAVLLVSALLCLSLSAQVHGRFVHTMKHFQRGILTEQLPEVNLMDYKDPGANTNPKNGAFFDPPNPSGPNTGH